MRLHLRLWSILFLTFILLTAAACSQTEAEPTPTPSPVPPTATAEFRQSNVQFIPYIDDALGLTFQYPANWIIKSSLTGVTAASSQAVIDAESLADIGSDGFVVIIPGEIAQFNFQTAQTFQRNDVMTALATYKALLEKDGSQFVAVDAPQAYTKTNQNMARMTLRSEEDGQPLITVMAVVMSEDYMALISAASLESTADQMRPIFDRIIESVEVRAAGGFSVGGS